MVLVHVHESTEQEQSLVGQSGAGCSYGEYKLAPFLKLVVGVPYLVNHMMFLHTSPSHVPHGLSSGMSGS